MAAKFLLLRSLLRIITPDEINELSSNSTSSNRENLTDLIYENYFTEEFGRDAEVISLEEFKNKKNVEEEAIDKNLDKESYTAKVEANDLRSTDQPIESLAEFLFYEKEKMKKNVTKIKHKEILCQYKKNAQLDVEQQRRFRNDLSKSSSTGVLVNKKQA